MENDLISRSALYSKICALPSNIGLYDADEVERILKEANAVDAVIPVRCAQCKHFKRNLENDTYCSSVNGLTDPQEDDFCSYGEWSADDDDD